MSRHRRTEPTATGTRAITYADIATLVLAITVGVAFNAFLLLVN